MNLKIRRTLELILLAAAIGIAAPFLIEWGKRDARQTAEFLGVVPPTESGAKLYPVEAP